VRYIYSTDHFESLTANVTVVRDRHGRILVRKLLDGPQWYEPGIETSDSLTNFDLPIVVLYEGDS
jgi:hypothetical protein